MRNLRPALSPHSEGEPDLSRRSIKILGCATVVEELRGRLPEGVGCDTLDFGLHTRPDSLRSALQDAIDASQECEVIVLGYGLCSMAVIGLQSARSTLVIPRVDDCIAIFLGSREAFRTQSRQEPGTYYLTKGWLEVGSTPFDQYDRTVAKYGPERAKRLMDACFRHYTRLVLINTGQGTMGKSRAHAQQIADRFGLRYEEIPGSRALVDKMIHGPWDHEFVVVPPGQTVELAHFHGHSDGTLVR